MSQITNLSISLLPILSKVIERLFTNKQLNFQMITTYSINNNLASEVTIQQTYFYHFPIKKFWKILTTMYTGMILIDLKAFDTINHKILLDKLLPIGFSKNTISWCESYLAEHHFTVEVANRVSQIFQMVFRKVQF